MSVARNAARGSRTAPSWRFYVLPHAVDRFRERVLAGTRDAGCTHEEARALLSAWLDADDILVRPHPTQDGLWVLYVERPLRFRVVLDSRALTPERPLPRVVTVRHWDEPPRYARAEGGLRALRGARGPVVPQEPAPEEPREPMPPAPRLDGWLARRRWHTRAVIWEYSGTRTVAWMAAEIGRRTGRPISCSRVQALVWELGAAPTTEQGWLRPSQVAEALGVSVQWVTSRLRAGTLRGHRNPGGRNWLVAAQTLTELLTERETAQTAQTPAQGALARAQGRMARQTARAARAAEQARRAEQARQERAQRAEDLRARRAGWEAARVEVERARAQLRRAEALRTAAWQAYRGGSHGRTP